MDIDGDGIRTLARTVVEDLIGAAELDALVATLLDHEVPPILMWRHTSLPVTTEVERVNLALDAALERSGKGLPPDIEVVRGVLLPKEPSRALLELAAAPGYIAIPEAMLKPPTSDSRVFSMIPDLWERLDNRGLLKVRGLDARSEAVFIDHWVVPYHQLLRRDFASRVNDALMSSLLRLQSEGVTLRLAVDERRLHRQVDHVLVLERDYWSGPHLDEARLDDPQRRPPEVLVHGWPPDDRPLLDNSLSVAVRTTLSGHINTIEIEEITDPTPGSMSDFQLVRYAHAQRDIERAEFVHLDGAVRVYDRAAYEERKALRWPNAASNGPRDRRKVFRLDGPMDTAVWADAVALWFRGNELVLEALDQLYGSGD